MASPAKQIFRAVNAIMLELKPIKKGRKNLQQGYQFRGVDDVMNAMSPLFAKHGIFPSFQSAENIREDEVISKQGGKGYHCVRRYTIRFYAMDESFIDVISDGEAIDYGDKASNKAMSVAYREAILKTFVIPFGNEDTENYTHDLDSTEKVQDDLGVCTKCGAPNKRSKTGNIYCSKFCWKNPKNYTPTYGTPAEQKFADELDNIPVIQQ